MECRSHDKDPNVELRRTLILKKLCQGTEPWSFSIAGNKPLSPHPLTYKNPALTKNSGHQPMHSDPSTCRTGVRRSSGPHPPAHSGPARASKQLDLRVRPMLLGFPIRSMIGFVVSLLKEGRCFAKHVISVCMLAKKTAPDPEHARHLKQFLSMATGKDRCRTVVGSTSLADASAGNGWLPLHRVPSATSYLAHDLRYMQCRGGSSPQPLPSGV